MNNYCFYIRFLNYRKHEKHENLTSRKKYVRKYLRLYERTKVNN